MGIKTDEYIYAVARIRCKEGKLFSHKNIDQMISMKDAQSVERYLTENGWSVPVDSVQTDILSAEQDALWALMKDLVGDVSCFNFLRVQNDFHNLKASVKAVYTECDPQPMFVLGSVSDPVDLYKAVLNKEYVQLPEFLRATAEEAMTTLLKTGDGQLCDAIIDKACLYHVATLGKADSSEVIREYCELFVASANIKIAVRGSRLNRTADFMHRSMAECDSLDIKALSIAASKSFDDICSYLLSTDYKDAVTFIKQSLSAFEKWCDNHIMNTMRTQKSDPFSIGPLVAYIIAKQTEIKAVRLILTAKVNDLDDSIIRERIREMYV